MKAKLVRVKSIFTANRQKLNSDFGSVLNVTSARKLLFCYIIILDVLNIESHLKMMKNAFYFIVKALSFSRHLNFFLDFLVM